MCHNTQQPFHNCHLLHHCTMNALNTVDHWSPNENSAIKLLSIH